MLCLAPTGARRPVSLVYLRQGGMGCESEAGKSGADEMKDGRVASNTYALKYLASVDQQRQRRDAAFARLPKRPAK